MSAQHHFLPGDQWDRDLYEKERVLNSAIIAADISRGWEEYLEIFDAFCYVAKSAFGRSYSTSLPRFM